MTNGFVPFLNLICYHIYGGYLYQSISNPKDFEDPFLDKLYRADFSYLLPVIDADAKLSHRKEEIKYVVGAKLDLNSFKKIVEFGTLNLDFEPEFEEKLADAVAVCISAPFGDKKIQRVTAIRKNDRVFDTPQELAESAKNFISAVISFYGGLVPPVKRKNRGK